MGYLTRYNLEKLQQVKPDGKLVPVDGATEEQIYRYAEDNYFGFISEESCKWYEWADDMATISKEFPNVLFTLTGEGEDSGDLWKAYCFNGEQELATAILTYPQITPQFLSKAAQAVAKTEADKFKLDDDAVVVKMTKQEFIAQHGEEVYNALAK